MKKHISFVFLITGLFITGCNKQEPMSAVIERGLQTATQQAVLMAQELENQEGKLPKTNKCKRKKDSLHLYRDIQAG